MAKLTAQEIIKKQGKAYSTKSSWDTEYRDIFEYCMPSRDGYQKAIAGEKTDGPFQDRRENLYSSVGEQAANEFVNTMQEVLAPPMSDWISMECGFNFKEEDKEKTNKELDKISEYANQYKNNSSFDMAFSEFCYDLFAGTACMLVLPDRPLAPISFKAIPIREYCIEEGVNAEVRAVFRKYSMKRELLGAQWKELKSMDMSDTSDKKQEDIELIESMWFDYDLNVYHYQVIDSAKQNELLAREYKTNPFIVLRWNKCAGEAYGRGVGLTAINDIKTLNLIKYYSMRNFAFQMPILLAQEDAMFDVELFDATPLSINVVPDTKSSIVPMDINPKYDAESYKTQELTMDIKKNTYSSNLPNEGNRELTATEVRARLAELRKSLNSVFGRLISEFQIPLVRRILDVLGDTQILGKNFSEQFDVTKVDGLTYKVNVITPIGKIVKYNEAQAILASALTLVQFDDTGAVFEDAIKFDETIERYLKLSGMPLDLIKTAEDAKKGRQAKAEAQARQQAGAMEADVEMDNQKAIGKETAKGFSNGG